MTKSHFLSDFLPAAEKSRSHHQARSSMRRTSSLDTIIGPYLIGQWPREADGHDTTWFNEKATQTPSIWHEVRTERKNSHKRSASWGSADQLKEIAKLRHQLQRTKLSKRYGKDKGRQSPLHGDYTAMGNVRCLNPPFPSNLGITKLIPRLRNSLEAINQEIEGMFIKEHGDKEVLRIMDTPDGHRAPFPSQRYSSSSQSDPSPVLLGQTNGYSSPSPYPSPSPSPSFPNGAQEEEGPSDGGNISPPPKYASSPKPNHSYVFKREPPEGCERVTAFEETPLISFGQVNFNPTGSAFCPVHILKPLFPTVDLILRHLPASGSSATPIGSPASSTTFLDLSKEQPLQFDHWKRPPSEESAFFQSSLVI
uniref:Protein FAM117A n=1 Tax=Callorhinchus milii TaxID=7868 RepID=A0A4W3HUX7_CALMI